MWCSMTDLFHLAWCFQGSSLLQRIWELHCFYCQIVFHWVGLWHFIYPFISWWVVQLVLNILSFIYSSQYSWEVGINVLISQRSKLWLRKVKYSAPSCNNGTEIELNLPESKASMLNHHLGQTLSTEAINHAKFQRLIEITDVPHLSSSLSLSLYIYIYICRYVHMYLAINFQCVNWVKQQKEYEF